MDAIDKAALSRWIKDATGRMGTRKAGVARANAQGGKVSYDSWRKAEDPDEKERPSDETLRAIALGLGLEPWALVEWRRDGGPAPALPERPTTAVEILPGVQREFDDLRARVDRIEETLLRVLEAVTGQPGAGGGSGGAA